MSISNPHPCGLPLGINHSHPGLLEIVSRRSRLESRRTSCLWSGPVEPKRMWLPLENTAPSIIASESHGDQRKEDPKEELPSPGKAKSENKMCGSIRTDANQRRNPIMKGNHFAFNSFLPFLLAVCKLTFCQSQVLRELQPTSPKST